MVDEPAFAVSFLSCAFSMARVLGLVGLAVGFATLAFVTVLATVLVRAAGFAGVRAGLDFAADFEDALFTDGFGAALALTAAFDLPGFDVARLLMWSSNDVPVHPTRGNRPDASNGNVRDPRRLAWLYWGQPLLMSRKSAV